MDPSVLVNLALMALQAVLSVIAEIKSQAGLTDDQILAAAQQITGANDTLYNTLKAAMTQTPSNSPIAAPPQS